MSALMPSVLAREQGARALAFPPHVPQSLPSAVGSGLPNVARRTLWLCLPPSTSCLWRGTTTQPALSPPESSPVSTL